jgi:hypothetical protein
MNGGPFVAPVDCALGVHGDVVEWRPFRGDVSFLSLSPLTRHSRRSHVCRVRAGSPSDVGASARCIIPVIVHFPLTSFRCHAVSVCSMWRT